MGLRHVRAFSCGAVIDRGHVKGPAFFARCGAASAPHHTQFPKMRVLSSSFSFIHSVAAIACGEPIIPRTIGPIGVRILAQERDMASVFSVADAKLQR